MASKRAPKAQRGNPGRKGVEGRIEAETHHVTALEIGSGSRRSAGVSCRWKAPRIGAAGLIFMEGSAARSRRPQKAPLVRKRSDGQWGGDRGVRGSAHTEVHGIKHRASTRVARRSGSGVVKRQVLQSPGCGCKPIAHGRSASFEEMLGTDEARVLVVEAVGSRSRSVCIGVVLRGVSQGKP